MYNYINSLFLRLEIKKVLILLKTETFYICLCCLPVTISLFSLAEGMVLLKNIFICLPGEKPEDIGGVKAMVTKQMNNFLIQQPKKGVPVRPLPSQVSVPSLYSHRKLCKILFSSLVNINISNIIYFITLHVCVGEYLLKQTHVHKLHTTHTYGRLCTQAVNVSVSQQTGTQ